MSTTELYSQIEKLPPQEQLVLAQQILAGLVPHAPSNSSRNWEKSAPSQTNQRVAGLHPGIAWVSEDFDEPLPDEFWLGDK